MGGEERACKMILLGNGSVGKSSIIHRLRDAGFAPVYKQTVGVDFFQRWLDFESGQRLLLQLWDVGGQSMGSAMLRSYLYRADGVFLTYDVTDPGSLSDLEDWIAVARAAPGGERAGGSPTPSPTLYLVGNKCDLAHLRRVSEADHDAFIAEHGLAGGFLVSARSGDRLLASFYAAAAAIANVPCSSAELESHARVVTASVASDSAEDAERTSIADQIEREDREAMERAQRGSGSCSCCTVA